MTKKNTGSTILLNEKGITWPEDKSTYKNVNLQNQWIDVTNGTILPLFFKEHFIVWMHTAALPDFRKRWALIEQDLDPGTYVVNIKNNTVLFALFL